jgi:translation initiation factor IF-3
LENESRAIKKGTVIARGPRLNDQIRITPIRLIDENNEQRGIVETAEALRMTRELGLDLVEIAPQERPPVCRIMDYGKHKYLQKKKQKQGHSQEMVLKEVRLRPKTDDHDREIKFNRAVKFIEQGHRVQFTMLFRGRERQHRDLALAQFGEIANAFGENAKIERPPKFEGRRMTMVLAPVRKAAKPPKPPKPKAEQSAKPPRETPRPPAQLPPDLTSPQPASAQPDDETQVPSGSAARE